VINASNRAGARGLTVTPSPRRQGFEWDVRQALGAVSVCLLVLMYVVALVDTFDDELGRCLAKSAEALATRPQLMEPKDVHWHLASCTRHPFFLIGNSGALVTLNWLTW
jgi:hypothetical protein